MQYDTLQYCSGHIPPLSVSIAALTEMIYDICSSQVSGLRSTEYSCVCLQLVKALTVKKLTSPASSSRVNLLFL